MNVIQSNTLTQALELKQKGFNPLPIKSNSKTPVASWKKYQDTIITDEELQHGITQGGNIAHVCNDLMEYNIACIDFDVKQGDVINDEKILELEDYLAEHAEVLTNQCIIRTPSGGIHIYVKLHKDISTKRLNFAVNNYSVGGEFIRKGGYFLIPPSSINRKQYHFINGSIEEIQCYNTIEEIEKVFSITINQPETTTTTIKTSTGLVTIQEDSEVLTRQKRYVEKVLTNSCQEIKSAKEGERNNILFKKAVQCFEYSSYIEESLIYGQLYQAGISAGLEPDEVTNTLQSAQAKGLSNPQQPPIDLSINSKYYPLTDLGNTERFINQHKTNIRYVVESKSWYVWTGKIWKEDKSKSKIESKARQTVRSIYHEAGNCQDDELRKTIAKWARLSESEGKRQAIIKGAERDEMVCVSIDIFDRDPYLFNCQNGTINLKTGQLQPHDKNNFITKISPVEYNQDATCPDWTGTVQSVFKNDTELINYFKKACGYTLTGDTKEQCLLFSYGKGKNGKTTILETLYTLMGDYGKKIQTKSLMANNSRGAGGASEDIARLQGARMILASETEDGKRIDESLVKDMTGGDTVAARYLYGTTFEFKLEAKIWMFGNYAPHVRGQDEGIKRRIKMLPFEHTFVNPDKSMMEKLKKESSGILNWIISGCIQWQSEGLQEPSTVLEATAEYFEENDIIGQFVNECVEPNEPMQTPVKDMYERYQNWNQGGYVVSKRIFCKELQERGIKLIVGSGNKRYFYGVTLVLDGDNY